jgi:hypothetical protein
MGVQIAVEWQAFSKPDWLRVVLINKVDAHVWTIVRQVIERYRLCPVYAADRELARRIFVTVTEHAMCRMKIPQQYRQCRNPLDILYINGEDLTLVPCSFPRSWAGVF